MKYDLQEKIYAASKNFLLSHSPEYLEPILQKFELMKVYEAVKNDFNTSSNVYHSFLHTNSVILNCYEGALFQQLTPSETKVLLLAAMFHDYNHTGTSMRDDYNIMKAITGLCSVIVKKFPELLTADELKATGNLIRKTQYPYTPGKLTISEKIIRDADLMTLYEKPETMASLYRGLMNEINHARTFMGKHLLTSKDFAAEQDKFLLFVNWNSNWAVIKSMTRNSTTQRLYVKRLIESF